MDSLPILTNGSVSQARLSEEKLLHFESMLTAVDDMLETNMNARLTPCVLDNECSAGVLQAMVSTICVLTDSSVPLNLTTKTRAVEWASESILKSRDRAVKDAKQNNMAYCMDPQHISSCMELISKLNAAIGNTPGQDSFC